MIHSAFIDAIFQMPSVLIKVAATMLANDAIYRSEINAVATSNSALINKTDTLQTTVNGNTASILKKRANLDGLYAQKYIKLDVNGKVAGSAVKQHWQRV